MPDDELDALKKVKGSSFEAVQSVDGKGDPIQPGTGILPRAVLFMNSSAGSDAARDLLGRWLSPGRPIRPGNVPGIPP